MLERLRKSLIVILSLMLCFYTIVVVNYNVMQPLSSLAIFVMLGIALCFLMVPAFSSVTETKSLASIDLALRWLAAGLTFVCFTYIVFQTEPVLKTFWPSDEPFMRPTSLGNRAGVETRLDLIIGWIGLFLVLEATRRSIGWIVPALSLLFVLHAWFAPDLPDWLLPHSGLLTQQIVSSTFLQSLGVLGPAASVMFQYVFLFVVFGAFLEMSGATQFIIDFSQKLFGRGAGGPAKVAVLGSGLMGSLSGSAVANAVTTGAFTIPMMRNAGFERSVAAGITAAAATGGALVPPVMGAGAYMMLEFVERPPGQPQVTFLEIAKSALIPSILFYFSLWMIVHFYARRMGSVAHSTSLDSKKISIFEACVFFGTLGFLIALLVMGLSPFKAVTGSLVVILVMSIFRRELKLGTGPRALALTIFLAAIIGHQFTANLADSAMFQQSSLKSFLATSWQNVDGMISARQIFDSLLNSSFVGMLCLMVFGIIHPAWRPEMVDALTKAARNGIPLIAASACVGIIIGIVQTTSMAQDFGEAIKGVVETNLFLALVGIMGCSIVLGMGVPSVVCYLLMATLMGSLLGELGVDPLAAHLFIFYYGMMSMVTPPVALAAYASASIAEAPIMKTAFESFRFSLIGFTLPFMFIYRPGLLLMGEVGQPLHWMNVVIGCVTSLLGVIAMSAAVTGFLRNHVNFGLRTLLFVAAALLLAPKIGGPSIGLAINVAGAVLLGAIILLNGPTRNSH